VNPSRKLSLGKALSRTGQLARSTAIKHQDQGVDSYFAFGCERRSAHLVYCIAGIASSQANEGCIQVAKVAFASSRSKTIRTRLVGDPLCGSLEYDGDDDDGDGQAEGSSGGSSGEGTAICAIRQSVCI